MATLHKSIEFGLEKGGAIRVTYGGEFDDGARVAADATDPTVIVEILDEAGLSEASTIIPVAAAHEALGLGIRELGQALRGINGTGGKKRRFAAPSTAVMRSWRLLPAWGTANQSTGQSGGTVFVGQAKARKLSQVWAGTWRDTMDEFSQEVAQVTHGNLAVAPTLAPMLEASSNAKPARSNAKPASTTAKPASGAGAANTPPVFIRPSGEKYVARWWPTAKDWDVHAVRRQRELSRRVGRVMPLMIDGAPGGGKTGLLEAALGTVVELQGNSSWERTDAIGSGRITAGNSTFDEGDLIKALKHKHDSTCETPCNLNVVYFDEINLAPVNEVSLFHPLLDGRKVFTTEEHGTIFVPDDFWFVCSINRNVPGALMSPAMISRMSFSFRLETDYATASMLGTPDPVVDWARSLQAKERSGGSVGNLPSLRDILPFAEIANEFGEEFAWENLMSKADEISLPHWVDAASRSLGREVAPLALLATEV